MKVFYENWSKIFVPGLPILNRIALTRQIMLRNSKVVREESLNLS